MEAMNHPRFRALPWNALHSRFRLAFAMDLLTQEAGASAALRPQAEPGDEFQMMFNRRARLLPSWGRNGSAGASPSQATIVGKANPFRDESSLCFN